MMRFISIFVCIICALTLRAVEPTKSADIAAQTEAVFRVGVPKGDASVEEILRQKTRSIIGRIGCGGETAIYEIVPTIEVDETKSTSGTIRKVTVVKGTLTLEAVSAGNPDMVWHSASIPLKATVTGSDANPAEALANQIQVSDSRFVRFVRVARKKIAEASRSVENSKEL